MFQPESFLLGRGALLTWKTMDSGGPGADAAVTAQPDSGEPGKEQVCFLLLLLLTRAKLSVSALDSGYPGKETFHMQISWRPRATNKFMTEQDQNSWKPRPQVRLREQGSNSGQQCWSSAGLGRPEMGPSMGRPYGRYRSASGARERRCIHSWGPHRCLRKSACV